MSKIEAIEQQILWEEISLPFPGFDKPYLAAGMDRIMDLRMELAGERMAEMLRDTLL